jgi:hypothetical protein
MTAHACRRCKDTCPATNPEWEGHGKASSYDNHRCRCAACTEANREKFRRRRQEQRAQSVTRSPSEAAKAREASLTDSDRAIRAMKGWDTRRTNQRGSAA